MNKHILNFLLSTAVSDNCSLNRLLDLAVCAILDEPDSFHIDPYDSDFHCSFKGKTPQVPLYSTDHKQALLEALEDIDANPLVVWKMEEVDGDQQWICVVRATTSGAEVYTHSVKEATALAAAFIECKAALGNPYARAVSTLIQLSMEQPEE